ncbi:nuclear transport factor 2 family protein [Scytonema sp. NUACC26]|uniref:nuclear transport factor 2 family protein n=1 Tax=Scytonema sp. NUACC26 TaxID=3140176 RepID=UPI0034DC2C41
MGIDFNSEELLVSSLTPDAVVDFTQGNKLWGLDFPVLTGRDPIIQLLKASVCLLVTTHSVTNPRTEINGDTAKLYAIVEAQHIPPNQRSRHCLMKNQYDVSLVREGEKWLIKHLIVNGVWFTGEPSILIGQ